jgi:hypothetical protein
MTTPNTETAATPSTETAAPSGSIAQQALAEALSMHGAENGALSAELHTLRKSPAKPAADDGEEEGAGDGGVTAPDAQTDSTDADDAPETAETDTKGAGALSWEQAIKRVDPEVATLMKSMQGDYTRKTQELAAQRKSIEADRALLAEQALHLQAPPETELGELDPFDPASIQAHIDAKVRAALAGALKPIRDQHESSAAEQGYASFVTSNPDFETDTALRSEVQAMLEGNESLDLETAYWAAKGKLGRTTAPVKAKVDPAVARAAAKRKANQRAATTATGTGRRGGPIAPVRDTDYKSLSNRDILRLAESMNR